VYPEQSNEPSGYINGGKFLDLLRYYQLLKETVALIQAVKQGHVHYCSAYFFSQVKLKSTYILVSGFLQGNIKI
jgi:hypothetical protein